MRRRHVRADWAYIRMLKDPKIGFVAKQYVMYL